MISVAEKRFGYALTAATIISIAFFLLAHHAMKIVVEAPDYSGLTDTPTEATVLEYEIVDLTKIEPGEGSVSISIGEQPEELLEDRYFPILIVGYHPAGTDAMATGKANITEYYPSEEEALAYVEERYPLSSSLDVYYNPERFERVSLTPPKPYDEDGSIERTFTAFKTAFGGIAVLFILGRFWWSSWARQREIPTNRIVSCSCSLLLLPFLCIITLLTILSFQTEVWPVMFVFGAISAAMLWFVGRSVYGVLQAPEETRTGEQPTRF